MEQHAITTESDVGARRRAWFTTLRLGIAMAALGMVAALALVLVPGGTGPSDTLAVADLSDAGLAVDSARGPTVNRAGDLADGDRYVSANPFASLRTSDGGGVNASFGLDRLTSANHGPGPGYMVCEPLIVSVPGGMLALGTIDTGYEVCTVSGMWGGSITFLRLRS